MRNTLILSSAAAMVLTAASAQAQIVNGGFENPTLSTGTYAQYFNGGGFNGWQVTGSDVLLLQTNYAEPGIVFTAHSGLNSLDLTGAGNTSPLDSVNQSLATSIGQAYRLSFYVGRGDDSQVGSNYLTPSTVDVSVDGGSRISFTNSDVTLGGVNWKQFSLDFVATGASTNIAFLNGTPTANNNFAGLDDVSVQAVPEPTTMAALGLGALGLLRRRSRRA